MSIEIKITLPSADSLNNNGWARNSIFRIIEGGGQVESSAIMSIYRSLDKRKRLDFIKKSLHCCEFTKAELNEILTNHKRSPWVQTVAVVCQPAFSKEFRLQKLEETVKKTTTALEKTKKDILDTSRSPYDSWRFGKLIDNPYLQMITHCLRRGQVSQISIDAASGCNCSTRRAADSPANPAPTMATSAVRVPVSVGCLGAGPRILFQAAGPGSIGNWFTRPSVNSLHRPHHR